jgi:S1-C subfamily serine protease
MSRIFELLGIVAAIIVGTLAVIFSGGVTVVRTPAISPTASSTLSVVPDFSLPPLSLPALEPSAPAATSAPAYVPPVLKKKETPPPAAVTPASAPAAKPVAAPAPLASSGNIGLDASASLLRSALVNIICYAPAGSSLHSISGSGVIIDPKGIILTNAHVAQYFLLTDRGVSCAIRSGSPAADKYKAQLIYISPLWLRSNANVLTQTLPSGTGEYDFALLAVNKSVTDAALPAPFPSIPLAILPPPSGTPIVIASYGAQFLEANQVQSGLFPTVVFGSVKEVFTFDLNTIDVLSLGGSAAAQEGSSGGGVADASGSLVGTITTSTVEGATATRELDAITASYIRSEYASEMGRALDLLLAEPTAVSIADFAPHIPVLEAIITASLSR